MIRLFALLISIFTFSQVTIADVLQNNIPCDTSAECSQIDNQNSHWIDSSRNYVAIKSDSIAGWIDDFFGVTGNDIESASTSLRLQIRNRWEEHDGNDLKARLRGNIHFPKTHQRLSLIFTDEVEEGTIDGEFAQEVAGHSHDNTDVSLQYKVLENIRSRLDLHFGLRSSLNPKISSRYRYNIPLINNYFAKLTETIYWEGGDGFGALTRIRIDHPLENNKLLRWSNKLKYSEQSDGVEWSTNISLSKRLDDKRAIAYIIGTNGETRPDYLTTSYGVSVTFRQNIFRPWLFVEVEPAYKWKRDNIKDNRNAVAQITARLEIRFNDK